jgi:hypothetical protein
MGRPRSMGGSEKNSPAGHCLVEKSSMENTGWEAYELR